jgi:spore coat protein U-like protein
LNFGALDPIRPVDVATSTAVGFVCRGSAPIATFAITENGGLYSAGPGTNRMRHATVLSEYLPYRLALEPDSGTVPKNARQTLTITGTLRGADYSGSSAGSYADTVVVDILP